jgi:hypothetical protein
MYWPIVPVPGDCEDGEVGGIKCGWQGNPKYSEKTCPGTILSTTNPTCQTRVRTRAAAVGSQRLTASAMALPKFQVTLTKVRKMNLQVLLLKTKNMLHGITCPNTKNSVSKNNVHNMTAIRTYAFLEANAEILHGTLKHFHGNRSDFFSNPRFQLKDCRCASGVHFAFEVVPQEKIAHRQIW